MIHHFPYKEFDPIEIPEKNISGFYTLSDNQKSVDESELIKNALENPIGSSRLCKMVKPDMKIVVVVDDNSRNTRTDLMLPMVLAEIEKAGVKRENLTVFIALGTHRKMTENEIAEKYTAAIADNYRFVNPDWKNSLEYGLAGYSSSNFPIKIHKEILNSDFVIGVGQTIPHMIAGFGGGCKIINPGCADGETIGYMHWLCSEAEDGKLFAVRDNPVRQVIDEVGIKAGLKFIINEVPGGSGKIGGVFAGDPIEAHRQACEFAKKTCQVKLKEKADIVIADSYPADMDFWQALKGLNAAYGAVKDGGTVILVSTCPEGTSSQHSTLTEIGYIAVEKIKLMLEAGKLDKAVAANLFLGRKLIDKADTILVTKGISKGDTLSMGFGWAKNPESALKEAIKKHGEDAKINILYKASKMVCVL
jgi:nickel-dependent lactate racemase